MYCPDKKSFMEKARHGNVIPVWRELLADQDTPLSAYERLRTALRERHEMPCSFLLESVEGGEHIARYSFIGGMPRILIQGTGRRVELRHIDGTTSIREEVDPLDVLQECMAQYRPVPDPELPRFFGGAVGFIGYDSICQYEPRVPLCQADGLQWPDLIFGITDTIMIFDRVRHTIKVVANAIIEDDPEQAYELALQRIDQFCSYLATPVPHVLRDAHEEVDEPDFTSNVTKQEFMDAVETCKEYIRAGDIIQVVLSQRFEVDFTGDALEIYRALRAINPSPYMYCLEFGDKRVVGSSPEIHVRCEEGHVEVRPIAGTRPRDEDPAKDQALERELLADPKERAEHVMLVDLARNDLGRVCEYGSVRVPELMVIERYSHVMHIVSDVVGTLDKAHSIYDVLRATFPAGTVSGAPKIRAMEIIAELEKFKRGAYAGAVGYFGFTGNLDSCITIRTVVLDGETAYVQAGAGIVADSIPEKEFEETQNKARGMLKAIALSQHYINAKSS
ncbi:MAG: anthranilate synthase component I [Spartobacteria bacterium]|nr:anthranilate synthase component I [Spartobacteria bacterium]